MKFIVCTPFRCGSSFVTHFIEKNYGIRVTFPHNTPVDNLPCSMVVKTHADSLEDLKSIPFDHVITCIRKPTDVFISAYIKDFKTTDYPYTYEKDPIVSNIPDMINHFLSFEWDSFNWCSYDFNFKQIEQLTNLNIWQLPVNTETGVSYFSNSSNSPNLTVVNHQTLFDDSYFHYFQQLCKTEFKFKNVDRGKFSYRNADTYRELYHLFKNNVPQSFYEKYRDLDLHICNKFGIPI